MSVKSELQKEFELERIILFSDAVFAIAITLLIIEIKFPEIHKGASNHEILLAFRPVMIRFAGFIISFIIVGLMWSRHLRLCKYLRAYNNGVVARNLVFLFFIVCFPFTASGLTEFIRPSFLLPVYIYLVNLALLALSHFALCHYVFVKQPQLSVEGFAERKKLLVLQSQYSSLILSSAVTVVVILSVIFRDNSDYVLCSLYIIPLFVLLMRKRLKKLKKLADDSERVEGLS